MTKLEHGNWYDYEWGFVRPGIHNIGFAFSSEGTTLTIGEICNGHETKPHSHSQEQVVVILQGTCDFVCDGVRYPMKKGSWMVIPPNVEHYIHVYDSAEPVLNMDIFTPVRQEYVEKYKAYFESKTQEKNKEIVSAL